MHKHVFGLDRVLVAGALVALTGCGLDGLSGHDGGRVRLILAPQGATVVANVALDSTTALLDDDDDDDSRGSWAFQTATVTLSSILVRTNDGELIDLDVPLPVTVDVVKIDGGKSIQLPDGFLPAGDYDQVVLVITAVKAVANDGTIVTIEPPGGGWTAVIPICPIEVADGTTTTVGIGLNVRNSFVRLSNWWSFQPQFRSLNDISCDAS